MTRKTGEAPRRALLDHVPEMVTVSDLQGRIVYANPATERVSGYTPEEFLTLDPFSRMHPEDRPRCEEAFAELMRSPGLSLEVEHRVRHKDGSWRWVDGTFKSLFEDPEVGGLVATVRDITERKRVENALRASEEKYRTLFNSIDEGFCIIEIIFDDRGEALDYRFLEANPAFERQTGLENAVGKTMRDLAPEHEGFWFEIYGRVARSGEATRFEHEAGALGRFYDVYAFRIGEPDEDRVAIIFEDILERKRAEVERERLRGLQASSRAEVAERERISRELHDRVAHTMGVAHQSMELYSALAQSSPERAQEKLELARQSTRTALDQTRNLSAQLARRGSEETRDGLISALRLLLETHVPDGVEGKLSSEGDEIVLHPPVLEQAYLVMREAVRNAVAHSGCTRVVVSAEVESGELKGRVEDDGGGFDPPPEGDGPGHEDAGKGATGMGLRSMKERAETLGGSLVVSSDPGRGTVVELRIPLSG